MGAKYFIFAVIATIAQSFIALGSRHTQNSCGVPSSTEIDADLKTIDFAEVTGHMAYNRAIALIFSRIIFFLTDDTDSPDDTIFQNETETALMLGILPAWEAVQTIVPNVDVAANVDLAHSQIVIIARKICQAIEATRGKNYNENLAAFETNTEEAKSAASSLSGLFLTAMASDTSAPPAIQDLLACTGARIISEIESALSAIIDAIGILLSQHSEKEPHRKNDSLSAIKAAETKASFFLNAEVTHKYIVMRNVRIAAYLSQIGILPGLFAIQPVFAKSVAGTYEGR